MVVNTNIAALRTFNAVTATNSALQRSIQNLSTGLRINSAADDAAGLAISEKMRAQIRGLDRAVMNAQDGISMIQTAEGAMQEVHSMLQRMRELSIQAANDTLTQQDRRYIQLEIDQLIEELDRIANTTQFNTMKLLNGDADAIWSTNRLDTELFIRGSLLSRDQFGQVSEPGGNFKVSVRTIDGGQNQVLKSNIFMMASNMSIVAGKNARLSDVANFVDSNGVSMLRDPQTLTISFDGGGSASFTIYANDTIGHLGEKMAHAVWLASDGIASNTAQFVGNAFTGDIRTMEEIASFLADSASQIMDRFGIGGAGRSLYFDWTTGGFSMFARGGPTGPIGIYINEEWRNNLDDPNFSRILLHEMVHATVMANGNLQNHMLATGPSNREGLWLIEGLTEILSTGNAWARTHSAAELYDFILGGGSGVGIGNGLIDRTVADYNTMVDSGTNLGNLDYEVFYTAAYVVTRYFDEQSLANGGTGIRGLIELLNNKGLLNNNCINTCHG